MQAFSLHERPRTWQGQETFDCRLKACITLVSGSFVSDHVPIYLPFTYLR